MRISELAAKRVETRRVGIRFERRLDAFSAAVRLLNERNIDCWIGDDDPTDPYRYDIWVYEIQLNAGYVMGAMERTVGVPGFNEWERG
jgi:hypothetical protein